MKKREAKKIAQVNILVIILTIVLILALVIVIWNIFNVQIRKNLIQADTETNLMSVRIDVENPEGNLSKPLGNRINVSITRFDTGKLKKISENNTETTIDIPGDSFASNISLVSVMDLSGSMGDAFLVSLTYSSALYAGTFGECKINPNSACCTANNCLTQSGCLSCNGNFVNNKCYLYSLNSCCRTADCYTSSGCASCNGVFKKDSQNYYTPSCKIGGVEAGCFFDKEICTGVTETPFRGSPLCNGTWRNKLQLTQEANNNFIDSFLNNSGNEMGIVGFHSNVFLQSLSKDKITLHNKINSFTAGGLGTSICKGLFNGINILSSSVNKDKTIILMSDGNANYGCDPFTAKELITEELLQQAVRANQSNITIHTIGFGRDADANTLKRVANSTRNGTYTYADVSNLNLIYDLLRENITKQSKKSKALFSEEYSWDHIRVIVYNTTDSFASNITEIIRPMETKKISIPTGGLTNINKIEIYLIAYTKDKREYSRLLDRWEK